MSLSCGPVLPEKREYVFSKDGRCLGAYAGNDSSDLGIEDESPDGDIVYRTPDGNLGCTTGRYAVIKSESEVRATVKGLEEALDPVLAMSRRLELLKKVLGEAR